VDFYQRNNTPRVADRPENVQNREILEIPNSAGNHSSPFTSETVVSCCRYKIQRADNKDVALDSYKENFNGVVSFVKQAFKRK
jgi:nitrous-oxide reductase